MPGLRLPSALDRAHKFRAGYLVLLASCEIFQSENAGAEFIFAGDQGETGAKFTGSLEGFFKTKAFIPKFDYEIVPPQLARQTRGFFIHAGAEWSDVHIWLSQHVFR